ncbi:tetratricopeptide repeat protein [Kitasatospora sp. NPDC056181]|uniref:tetratricopeptide repeat protein n=1 Tax=Kitasatospora sp. NPDC056181 TaxID=3345737 RepID=UPI0035DFF036
MSTPEDGFSGIEQNVSVENSGVAFVQGSGTQHNSVTQNYFGASGLPPTPENLYRQGELILQAQGYDEAQLFLIAAAEAGYKPAMDLLSTYEQFGMGGGCWTRTLADMGDPDALYRLARKARAARDGSPERARHRDEAIELFKKALEAGREDALIDLGYLLHEAGRLEEAIPYLEQALDHLERERKSDEYYLEGKLRSSRKKLARRREKDENRTQGGTRSRWWRRKGDEVMDADAS